MNRKRLVLPATVAITVVVTLILVYAGTKLIGGAHEAAGTRPLPAGARQGTQARTGGIGQLSGDVFVTMQSGDVKRGADVPIALVTVTEQFESDWNKLVEEFKSEYGRADADFQRARQAFLRASDQFAKAAAAGAGEDGSAYVPDTPAWKKREQKFKDATQANDNAKKRWFAAGETATAVTTRYQAVARQKIAGAQPRLARTDVNGHYAFTDVPAGQYRVFAEYRVFKNTLRWMVAAEVKSGPNRIDLTNSNAGWPF
jgi:hypothetical protein